MNNKLALPLLRSFRKKIKLLYTGTLYHELQLQIAYIVITSQVRCCLTFAGQSFNILIVLRASG